MRSQELARENKNERRGTFSGVLEKLRPSHLRERFQDRLRPLEISAAGYQLYRNNFEGGFDADVANSCRARPIRVGCGRAD